MLVNELFSLLLPWFKEFPFLFCLLAFGFVCILKAVKKNTSTTSNTVRTEAPTKRPMDPPMSPEERKWAVCYLANFFLTNAKRTTSIVMQLWDCEFTFSCQHFLSWIQSLGIDLLWNGSKKYVNFVQLSAYRMVTTICCHDSSVCGSRTRVSSWPRSPVMLSNGWIEFVKWKISYNSFIANISHNQNSSF